LQRDQQQRREHGDEEQFQRDRIAPVDGRRGRPHGIGRIHAGSFAPAHESPVKPP
jgi:hypothetical protein